MIVFFVAAGAFAWLGWRRKQRPPPYRDTPTTAIRDLQPGFAEVKGVVRPIEPALLRSPLSDAPCVFFRFCIERPEGSSEDRRWVTVLRDQQCVRCQIDDGTGKVELDWGAATVDFKEVCHQSGGFLKGDASPKLKERLQQRYGFDTAGKLFGLLSIGKSLSYEEAVFPEGEMLYAIGTVVEQADGKLQMTQGKENDLFLVSDKSEETLQREWESSVLSMQRVAVVLAALGLLSFAGAGALAVGVVLALIAMLASGYLPDGP